jgi:formate--tetrahydrofolate ligase
MAELQPKLTVVVATTQALKLHGGVHADDIKEPNAEGLRRGFENLDKHVRNIQSFGQTVVVCFNRYAFDTEEEMQIIRDHCKELGVAFAVNNAFAEGGKGAVDLANIVAEQIEHNPSKPLQFTYDDDDDVKTKVEKIATGVYGAAKVTYLPLAFKKLKMINTLGYSKLTVCIAKTQYSFSDDPKKLGVPKGFVFTIRDFVISAGAEMIVAIAGNIMRMPGLPESPQAERINVVNGEIVGLS